MDVIGLGFDATDIPRVASVFDRFGDRFLRRIFTEDEIAYCMRRRDPPSRRSPGASRRRKRR